MPMPDALEPAAVVNKIVPKRATSRINKKTTKSNVVKHDVRKCRICGIYNNANDLCLIKDPDELLMPMIYMVINKTIGPRVASEIMERPFNSYLCHRHIRETLFFLSTAVNARYINCCLQVDKVKLDHIFETCEELKELKGFSKKPVEMLEFSKSFLSFFQNHRPTTAEFLNSTSPSAICQICLKTEDSEKCWLVNDDPAERNFWFMQAGFKYDPQLNGNPLAICRSHLKEYTYLDLDKENKGKRTRKCLDRKKNFTCAICSVVKKGLRMIRLPDSIEERIVCFNFIGAEKLYENGLEKEPPIVCRDHFPEDSLSGDIFLKRTWIKFIYNSGIDVGDGISNYHLPRKRCIKCHHLRFHADLAFVRRSDVNPENEKEYQYVNDLLNKHKHIFVCKNYLNNAKCPV